MSESICKLGGLYAEYEWYEPSWIHHLIDVFSDERREKMRKAMTEDSTELKISEK